MPMPPYPVICYAAGCRNEAAFKVAARWSDGITHELKTYYLTCPACLEKLVGLARTKSAQCGLAPGESLEEPGIYELHRGERDQALTRRRDLESIPRK